jgi:hypothetical protein
MNGSRATRTPRPQALREPQPASGLAKAAQAVGLLAGWRSVRILGRSSRGMCRRDICYPAAFATGPPGKLNSSTTLREPQRGHFKRPSSIETGNAAPRVQTSVSRSRRIAALHSRIDFKPSRRPHARSVPRSASTAASLKGVVEGRRAFFGGQPDGPGRQERVNRRLPSKLHNLQAVQG